MGADEQRAQQILHKLTDLAGPLPQELINLNRVLQLSRRAGEIQIYHIDATPQLVEILFTREFQMPPQLVPQLLIQYADRLQFIKTHHGDGLRVQTQTGQDATELAEELICFLQRMMLPKML